MSNGLLLGNINLVLLGVVLSFVIYKYFFRKYLAVKKKETYNKIFRGLKMIHPLAASAMLLIGLVHGYLMTGGQWLHTGSFIIVALLVMMGTFAAGKQQAYKQKWKSWHKLGAVFVMVAVLIHLNFPNII